MAIKEVAGAIRKYDGYIITSHVDVEGDAIGSELAIFYLLKQLGKNAVILNDSPAPDKYKFLSGWDKIAAGSGARPKGCENAIVVDCPTIERSGRIAGIVSSLKVKINIDHHVSNKNFADFNWVDPEASSCGEMVFNLYKEMGLNINEEIAAALYVAILTDTGSFRYDSTTAGTHRIAAELIKLGVHPPKIAQKIYETKSLADIGLLAKALSTVAVTDNGRISHMYVTKKMFDETNAAPDSTEGFINFARALEGSQIAVFFREDMKDAGTIHVGFRSKGNVNVNVLAGKFGGGGHPKASGCLVKGGLSSVMDRVLKIAQEFLV